MSNPRCDHQPKAKTQGEEDAAGDVKTHITATFESRHLALETIPGIFQRSSVEGHGLKGHGKDGLRRSFMWKVFTPL